MRDLHLGGGQGVGGGSLSRGGGGGVWRSFYSMASLNLPSSLACLFTLCIMPSSPIHYELFLHCCSGMDVVVEGGLRDSVKRIICVTDRSTGVDSGADNNSPHEISIQKKKEKKPCQSDVIMWLLKSASTH